MQSLAGNMGRGARNETSVGGVNEWSIGALKVPTERGVRIHLQHPLN